MNIKLIIAFLVNFYLNNIICAQKDNKPVQPEASRVSSSDDRPYVSDREREDCFLYWIVCCPVCCLTCVASVLYEQCCTNKEHTPDKSK